MAELVQMSVVSAILPAAAIVSWSFALLARASGESTLRSVSWKGFCTLVLGKQSSYEILHLPPFEWASCQEQSC